ncbi:MAG: PEP-CTERM sorting domain-containing protein [Myxococcota bacterium]|nr:PEP-CTERM sorting domain-containing protein [Myxococcota bacterium]
MRFQLGSPPMRARLSIWILCLFFGAIATRSEASSIVFHERAFADAVVDYSLHAPYDVAASALGANDWTADMVGVNAWGPDIGVALGDQGWLTLEFTDNAFGSSGNSDSDVWIYEIGGIPEEVEVEISVDGSVWLDVGMADRMSADFDYGVGLDIDPYFTTLNGYDISTRFSFVRLTDSGNNTYGGSKAGADIDAVAAIYPLEENVVVPEPATGIMVGLGVVGLAMSRRRSVHANRVGYRSNA